ncbi:MAG TPA: hypothetical protein VGN64_05280 [Dyadobacter sp.]|jgi:hypothetical protein|nr:hypothetical protein [Dyadobacter sp.]
MKKHIICHYKNGSLVFSTTSAYEKNSADQIVDVFRKYKLTTASRPIHHGQFKVSGRINLHYDPFTSNELQWDEVVRQMTLILNVLECEFQKLFPVSNNLPTGSS